MGEKFCYYYFAYVVFENKLHEEFEREKKTIL